MSERSDSRPHVVIVGGGFGGLEAAKHLSRAPVSVTLVDRQNHHCFQPLLYQVATAALSPADVAWPIRSIVGARHNVTVLMAEVTGVDAVNKAVRIGATGIPYDYLVLATGATHSYFGHDDWAAHAPGLKRIVDATEIRRRVLVAFERAELTEDAAERERQMTFVIVGGGPTGVEMAGAIAEVARHALPLDFHRIDPRRSRILLLEAGPRILPSFPVHLAEYARQALARMGVDVRVASPVTDCGPSGVQVDGRATEAATIIWAAGVRASPAAEWLSAPKDRAGRIEVGPDLTVPGESAVFAIGDTAAVSRDGIPVPGIAPAAKQMGEYVAAEISRRIAGKPSAGPFVYRHQGDLATIGRKVAVVKLARLELKGFAGWLFWSLVHIYFLVGARNRLAVALSWIWSYVTFQRHARLIVGADDERRSSASVIGTRPSR